ncbi:porin [Methylobacillus sp.]|uniref:porin n=1 Tax=Methylobacillus sp. TaxID=56818 RepID=UPI0012C1F597|nr:porin [Methylobacillus sp.]MPS47679.1 porin [Methylobacillus sp.]
MNKKLGLAVAGAVMAFGASAANAGIIIPAGDWTIDIGGNVNTYYTNTRFSGDAFREAGQNRRSNQVSTGLLPSAIGIGGKTRQNDLDIAFQFTFFTGVNSDDGITGANNNSRLSGAGDRNSINVRQAYLTFGDASWGTVKAGRDLGLFGSDAILSDMTLLGVGVGAGGPGNSTLGRIGSGYVYADWIGQIQYASPNWNGFSFAVAAREGLRSGAEGEVFDPVTGLATGDRFNRKSDLGFDAKVAYEWTGDVAGKVWAGYINQKNNLRFVDPVGATANNDYRSRGYDLGAKINVADFGLVGYYYNGRGLDGQSGLQVGGLFNTGGNTKDRGGYVQATYKLPEVGTKLGVSYGVSKSENRRNAAGGWDGIYDETENKSWIIGAYHPLTKSLNLVAEYAHQKLENDLLNAAGSENGKAKTISLGAILFF